MSQRVPLPPRLPWLLGGGRQKAKVALGTSRPIGTWHTPRAAGVHPHPYRPGPGRTSRRPSCCRLPPPPWCRTRSSRKISPKSSPSASTKRFLFNLIFFIKTRVFVVVELCRIEIRGVSKGRVSELCELPCTRHRTGMSKYWHSAELSCACHLLLIKPRAGCSANCNFAYGSSLTFL